MMSSFRHRGHARRRTMFHLGGAENVFFTATFRAARLQHQQQTSAQQFSDKYLEPAQIYLFICRSCIAGIRRSSVVSHKYGPLPNGRTSGNAGETDETPNMLPHSDAGDRLDCPRDSSECAGNKWRLGHFSVLLRPGFHQEGWRYFL